MQRMFGPTSFKSDSFKCKKCLYSIKNECYLL